MLKKKKQKEEPKDKRRAGFSVGFKAPAPSDPTQNWSPVRYAGDTQYEQIKNDLEHNGVTLFTGDDIDAEYLKLPAMLTDVHSRDLGNYFNSFTKQKMYCRTLQGEARALVRDIERDLDDIRLDIYRSLATKMSIKEKEMHVQEHATAAELMRQADYYRSKLQILTDYISSIEDAIVNVSREITRRENDMEEHRRGGNLR